MAYKKRESVSVEFQIPKSVNDYLVRLSESTDISKSELLRTIITSYVINKREG